MKVEFFYDSELLKATCFSDCSIPRVGDVVYLDKTTYEVGTVCFNCDENIVQITLTDF